MSAGGHTAGGRATADIPVSDDRAWHLSGIRVADAAGISTSPVDQSSVFQSGNKHVEIGVGYGAVDEAVPLRCRGIEIVAAEQNLQRAGTAQKRGKPFDGAPAGNDADRDFGLAEECALEARETQITCQHELIADPPRASP